MSGEAASRFKRFLRFPFDAVIVPLAVLLVLLDYVHRSTVFAPVGNLPEVAVVFTGQFDRVHTGLDLLEQGHVRQLFISGVNPRAGITVSGFAKQFELTPAQTAALDTGRIVLATMADNTIENAVETACWLRARPEIETVVLVTSPWHMARASRALDRAISGVKILRVESVPREGVPRLDTWEFGKFIATWAITLLPRSLWPVDEPQLCQITDSNPGFSLWKF